jgi:hypothetical protein
MRSLVRVGVTAAAVLWSSGCYVASLAPFYTSQDVVFDAGLPGTWVGNEDEVWTISRAAVWTISREKDLPDSYTIEVLERASFFGPEKGPKVKSVFSVRLFRLDDMLFMDAFPAASTTCGDGPSWNALRAGMHYVFRVSRDGDTLRLQALDPDKVDALVQVPSHVHLLDDGDTFDRPGGPGGANLVLTAPTTELQAFIRRHLEPILQDEIGVMRRRDP